MNSVNSLKLAFALALSFISYSSIHAEESEETEETQESVEAGEFDDITGRVTNINIDPVYARQKSAALHENDVITPGEHALEVDSEAASHALLPQKPSKE